ncbi:prolipoprotein diacylglyceryl transferase [Candidatus Albibeggiatoa sp. nov. NOAA]|uniref:prolipoprotein diacylglyceryl transferase n=1 Tax=Candidatus Albibeggiatoa sp. nov. NOAA TaxID=3162724 RepID=UPI0032F11524|nr:prolipoprotein diacylglyceryl transferase [Thiotrichaceae bacterium]
MLTYPEIDPVMLSIGPLKIHWYGMMYLVGFLLGWWLGVVRSKRPDSPVTAEQMGDLVFYIALGVVLGGRFGYILFYNLPQYIDNPLDILKVWQGGMAFHGGLLGVLLATWLYARYLGRTFFQITDFIAPLVPLGLMAGRIGNFINAELWGRVSDVPWAMVFPGAGDLARHPSQLYQALLEGLLLFIILWVYSRKPRPTMAVSGLFLIGYGVLRSFAEFFREPDAHLGFIAFDWLTMGQILSVPMILFGILLMTLAYRNQKAN